MKPFYFQIRPTGKWHEAVDLRVLTKTVIAKCGVTGSYDRKNAMYRDTETPPYAGGWCKQCRT